MSRKKMTNKFEDHMDPSSEITLEVVKQKAIKGILALTGRTFILRFISFAANGLLLAFLDPVHFGAFLLVSAMVNFLSYFADIGLGAVLIQKKDKPEKDDFKTVFTVQEILVVSICLILLSLSPYIAKSRSLSLESVHLLYALTLSFFMASLKNIPSIILERKMEFGKFIVPQILEDLFYNVSIVYFAWRGFGLYSFTYSVIIRGIAGVAAIYILQPWKPGLAFSKKSLKNLLGFGIPYQLNNFLATVKDDGLTIVLGGILGPAGLGFLGNAQKLSQYPLRFFLDNVTKVTFPAFSRMQDDKPQLSRGLTRSTFFICSLVFPSLVGLNVLFPVIIQVIPRYLKWEPLYIPLMFLSANAAIGAFTSQFTNTLNAIGKIKTTFKFMIMWTVLSWGLIPLMSLKNGFVGAAQAHFLVSLSSFFVYFVLKKKVDFEGFYALGKPFIASFIMGLSLILLRETLSYDFFGLTIMIISGSSIYAITLYLTAGKSLFEDVKKTFTSVFNK